VSATPEQFCFGLLKAFDVKQMAALVARGLMNFAAPSERTGRNSPG
jgi:hypothetical protein